MGNRTMGIRLRFDDRAVAMMGDGPAGGCRGSDWGGCGCVRFAICNACDPFCHIVAGRALCPVVRLKRVLTCPYLIASLL